MFETAIASAQASGHDRADARVEADRVTIALADGAGGTARAVAAAEALIAAAMAGGDACELIERVDAEVEGHTTAVVIVATPSGLQGASVGDSQAWIIGDSVEVLTEHQRRKPLVGDGCIPVALAHGALGSATLLVASDGLFSYARRDDIVRIAQHPDLARAAHGLVELVRLPSGAVPDDVTVVLARRR